MKKNALIAALYFGLCLQGLCQYNESRRIDSTRLDSLKKTLPLLKDSSRVNALNEIAVRLGHLDAKGGFTDKNDSIRAYASKANEEATKIGYKKGIAMSLIILSGFEAWQNKPYTDTATKYNNILKAIQIAELLQDNEVLGWGHLYLNEYDSKKVEEKDRKALGYFLKAGDTLHAAEVANWLTVEYIGRGEYEKAYDYGKESVELSKKSGTYVSNYWHDFLIQFALTDMAEIYTAAGDYESAMNNLREANQYGIDFNTEWLMTGNIADLFLEMKQYDSAYVYWNKWRDGKIFWTGSGLGYAAWANSVRGRIYLANKEYDKAIEIFRSCNDTLQKYPRKGYPIPMGYLFLLGQAYHEKNDYKTALIYTNQAMQIAQYNNEPPSLMKCYQLISLLYHKVGKNDSAYKYIINYNTIRDSIQTKQFLLRIYNARKDADDQKKEARLSILDKDNKLKTEELKQESRKKNLLLVLFAVFVVTGIFIYRSFILKRRNAKLRFETELKLQKSENDKKDADFQRQTAELEMQALRAQMNPHFIFNCLSSINKFILKNDTDTASDYLTRFSRLIRQVLTNSQLSYIPLNDEIEMLRLYLDMERLRFSDSFDYNISYENTIEPDMIYIPPMLLQPFCENAIWHGLMHLPPDSQGRLQLQMSTHDGQLQCVITDNGIGRTKAAELQKSSGTRQRSFGLKITTERLALFNNEKAVPSFYQAEDILDAKGNVAGTKVILNIKIKGSVQQPDIQQI